MEYSKFNINKSKMCKTDNMINKNNEKAYRIYNAGYPPYVTKVAYKNSENCERAQSVNRTAPEFCAEENVCSGKRNNGVTSFLCGVLSFALLILGVYMSGMKAPGYVERAFMSLVELKYKSGFEDIASVSEKVKVIGGKMFVSAEPDNNAYNNTFESTDSENSRFAQSVRDSKTEYSDDSELSVASLYQPEADNAFQVIGRNMSKGNDKIYCTNRTELEIDANELLYREYPIEKYNYAENSQPLVFIIHTHGTEAYIDTGENGNTRSYDTEKNIVRVGTEIKNVLESYGIPVIHSKTMHDKESYVNAYASSKKEAMEYLKNYPSIKYVIDVHRDALGSSGDTPIKTYAEINSEPTAQLMFVMGTNASGGDHPDYRNNLTVAAHIQDKANSLFPDLMRPLNIRPIIFNQNLADGCMILEVGSDANTLAEALEAARMFGRCFAETAIQ